MLEVPNEMHAPTAAHWPEAVLPEGSQAVISGGMRAGAVAESNLGFNPHPRVEVLRFGDGGYCSVVDDLLLHPEHWLRYAAQRREQFVSALSTGYPGVSLAPDPAAVTALRDFFMFHIRRHFDARRMVRTMCRYSMVTLASEQLSPAQSICHQDPPVEAGLSRTAFLLYLFHDSALGGTSFYESMLSFAGTSQLFADANAMTAPQFTERYGIRPSYTCDSNAYFRSVATVQARWNRAIFYSGALLHSGRISAPDRLTSDPVSGRLTLNAFFDCQQNLPAS